MKKLQCTALTPEEQQMVVDNMGLVYGIAKHFNDLMNVCDTLRIDWDDYISLMYIALCKAVRSYDVSRGAKLITAFWVVAENEIKREFVSATRLRRKANIEAYSLDYISERADGLTFGELLLDEEQYSREDDILTRMMLLDAIEKLTQTERDVIMAYHIGGMNQAELGSKYGVTHARIGQILRQAREKLKKELEAI